MRVAQVCVAAALVAVIAGQGYLEGDSYKQFDPVEDYGLDPHSSTWKFTASKGIVTGGYGPEPFCYDGDSSCFYAVDATAQVELDTVDNVGSIFIEFDITDYDLTNHTQANETFTNGILPIITQAPGELMGMTGRFRLEYTVFKGSASAPFKEGGVADNVIMHGHDPSVEDAFNGAAEFPLCSAFVASWGPVNVMFRATGENEFTPLFPNNIQEGRPPGIIGHTMLTEQFYFENKVYKNNGRLQGEECPFTDYYNGWGDQNQTDFGQGCASETKAPNEYHVNVKADGAGTDRNGAIGIFPFWMHIYFPEIEDNSELIVDQSGLNPIWYAAIGLGVLALAGAAFVLTKKSEASGAIELKDKV